MSEGATELLCRIRDLQRTVADFERGFERLYGICLNEGMVLCSLRGAGGRLSAGELGDLSGLTASNVSKVLAAVERKGFVGRALGDDDRRRMYFELTPEGERLLDEIRSKGCEVPPLLRRALAVADS